MTKGTVCYRSQMTALKHKKDQDNSSKTASIESLEDINSRLKKFGKIREEDRKLLYKIFQDVSSDPNWYEESIVYGIYKERIPVQEILGLLSADDDWSHMASKKQVNKVFDIFDKVYGFNKGLSRLEEQQKRYQKIKDL